MLHIWLVLEICTRSEKIQHRLAMSNTVYCNAIIHYNTIQQSTLQLHCTQEAHTIILCLGDLMTFWCFEYTSQSHLLMYNYCRYTVWQLTLAKEIHWLSNKVPKTQCCDELSSYMAVIEKLSMNTAIVY